MRSSRPNSIISRLNSHKHLLKEALQKPRNLATHAHLTPLIPIIKLLEPIRNLTHQSLNPLMALLSMLPAIYIGLRVLHVPCTLLLVLEVEVVGATVECGFEGGDDHAGESGDFDLSRW